MKRLYIICFLALVTLFAGCYCLGYYVVINNSEEPSTVEDYYEVRATAAGNKPIVKYNTEIIIQEHILDTGEITEYSDTPDIEELGLDKDKYKELIEAYVANPSETDSLKGLVSMDLVEFDSDRIVVRKNYQAISFNIADYDMAASFILYDVNGKVVIYYEDFVTIYDYTNIDVNKLSETLQQELKAGKQVNSIKELYEFLEEHTS